MYVKIHGTTIDQHRRIYAEPVIQQVISKSLFKNKNDIAICWKQYYYPFPHIVFAITLMAVGCGFDKWASGKWELINFSKDNYKGTVFTIATWPVSTSSLLRLWSMASFLNCCNSCMTMGGRSLAGF
ncbi:hypothetical protein J3R82DRAFT_1331 [Butyriboletus roseoflavus]|nr:hypothetical protein J3R82DRAFT_1331 [Butyriboletus roseoflavus]